LEQFSIPLILDLEKTAKVKQRTFTLGWSDLSILEKAEALFGYGMGMKVAGWHQNHTPKADMAAQLNLQKERRHRQIYSTVNNISM